MMPLAAGAVRTQTTSPHADDLGRFKVTQTALSL
jgi:hypothetical protein